MRTWISNRDLKTLFQGISGVAACGLALGAVMQPTLAVGDKPGGPQILLSGGGPRGAPSAADPGVGAYAGQTPDYVVGADWTRPAAVYIDTTPIRDQGETVVFTSEDDLPPIETPRAAWRDDPRDEPAYPSARGGAYYDANLPVPPAPPSDESDLGADGG